MTDAPVGRIKGFTTAVVRLGASIAIGLLALAAVCAGGYWVYTYPERQQAKAAEAVRNWSADLSKNLGLKLQARTKVTDGRLHATMKFDGYPDFLKYSINNARGFNLEWRDADGFTRIQKFVPLSEFSTNVDDKGKPFGLTAELSDYVSVADYSTVATLKVGWTLETDAPLAPPSASTSVAAATSDHCAPGLTRQERLRRLGQHGALRETGYNTFSAGSHTVTLSGAEVIFCS